MTPSASFDATTATAALSGTSTPRSRAASSMEGKKKRLRKSWGGKKTDFDFNAANDVVGIVMLEIQGAKDLPRLKNSASLFIFSLSFLVRLALDCGAFTGALRLTHAWQ